MPSEIISFATDKNKSAILLSNKTSLFLYSHSEKKLKKLGDYKTAYQEIELKSLTENEACISFENTKIIDLFNIETMEIIEKESEKCKLKHDSSRLYKRYRQRQEFTSLFEDLKLPENYELKFE